MALLRPARIDTADQHSAVGEGQALRNAQGPRRKRPPDAIDLPSLVQSWERVTVPYSRGENCDSTASLRQMPMQMIVQQRTDPDKDLSLIVVKQSWSKLRPQPRVQVVTKVFQATRISVVVEFHSMDRRAASELEPPQRR